jgi:hypothetical protein
MTWEEREPTLTEREDALRAAWLAGRGEQASIGGFAPPLMVALGRAFPGKATLYATLQAWRAGHRAVVAPQVPLVVGSSNASASALARINAALRELETTIEPGTTLHAVVSTAGILLFKGTLRAIEVQGRSGVRANVDEILHASSDLGVIAGAELVAVGSRMRIRSTGVVRELAGVEVATFVTSRQRAELVDAVQLGVPAANPETTAAG